MSSTITRMLSNYSSASAEPSNIKSSGYSCKWTSCPHTFASTHDLQIHITHDHIATATTCKCHWQGCLQSSKTFSRKNSLVNHAKTHACSLISSSTTTSPSMPLTRSSSRRSYSMTDVPHSNSLPTTSSSLLPSCLSPLARSSSLVLKPGRSSRKQLSVQELVDPVHILVPRSPSSIPVQRPSSGQREIQQGQQQFSTPSPQKKLASKLPELGLRGDVLSEGASINGPQTANPLQLAAPVRVDTRVESAADVCAFRNIARELGTGLSDVFGDICGEFRENEFGEKADPTDLF
ncbi:hypothetical protein BJ741DRAFT_614812 [Chytriomyces cf. hyalinus JEL632]|nr:hypothetical protein BJ741DRAFT_614812 [Chytriomyces cf. hyalinus JEL632]